MTGVLHRATIRRLLAGGATLAALCAAASPASAATGGAVPDLNVALAPTASASATSEGAGTPASAAIDGSASTPWCSAQWTGTLTVDLGAVRQLDGAGMTLGPTSVSALVNLSYAGTDGVWHAVPAGQSLAPPANDPAYVPFAGGLKARQVRVEITDNDGTPPCIGELRLFGPEPARGLVDLGADLSFLPQEEAAGAHYSDLGVPGSALDILRAHGLNYVRMRLWVDPPAGYSDLQSDLALARRVTAAGAKLYLDIHYSDFWADPQHEDTPAAWVGQPLPELARTVRAYTRDVLAAFAAQGTPVDMVSIGNEVRNGFLWPTGRVDWTANTGWDAFTTLLRAGVAGAHAGNPAGHRLHVLIHFDQGADNADSRTFYDHLVAAGVRFDTIGLSYYPFFHGPLVAFRQNVDDLAVRYHKTIVVAESQYAWTLANGDGLGNFVWQPGQLEPGYPATPGGQLSFYSDLLSILAQVPDGKGAGLFYWEPEWIPGVGWEPGAGTPNDNLTLFAFDGRALPSVGIFQSPLAVCATYAPHSVPCEVPDGASS